LDRLLKAGHKPGHFPFMGGKFQASMDPKKGGKNDIAKNY
jgi:hypothetical protein